MVFSSSFTAVEPGRLSSRPHIVRRGRPLCAGGPTADGRIDGRPRHPSRRRDRRAARGGGAQQGEGACGPAPPRPSRRLGSPQAGSAARAAAGALLCPLENITERDNCSNDFRIRVDASGRPWQDPLVCRRLPRRPDTPPRPARRRVAVPRLLNEPGGPSSDRPGPPPGALSGRLEWSPRTRGGVEAGFGPASHNSAREICRRRGPARPSVCRPLAPAA